MAFRIVNVFMAFLFYSILGGYCFHFRLLKPFLTTDLSATYSDLLRTLPKAFDVVSTQANVLEFVSCSLLSMVSVRLINVCKTTWRLHNWHHYKILFDIDDGEYKISQHCLHKRYDFSCRN